MHISVLQTHFNFSASAHIQIKKTIMHTEPQDKKSLLFPTDEGNLCQQVVPLSVT